jgi:hypothetical protein
MPRIIFALSLLLACSALAAEKPLRLHPDNPHYFLFREKPTLLITSGEHYGAVLNAEFDYVKYLDELAAHKLNNTRLFSGAYCEPQGAFNIAKNTLAPAKDKFLAPWARGSEPGYPQGGNKFDVTKWDEAYFKRLKDFVRQAGERGIVVEMNLFCPFYEETQWNLSPMKASNNLQGVGKCARTDVYTLDKHDGLLKIHDALTEKIVTELNEFDNVYYEICNEPYFGGVTMAWQHHIADTIVAAEKKLPHQHLISQNVANGSAKIEKPHPAIGLFNFHYASPPKCVAENFALNKAIGDNETGFKGTGDEHYRKEAWQFVLAGGGLYNNLDYSFTVGHEDGTFEYPSTQPGGGNRGFRQQMQTLVEFINAFDFVKMQPDAKVVRGGLPEKAEAYVLSQPGKAYALYLFGKDKAKLQLALPSGTYRIRWVYPKTGLKHEGEVVRFQGETLTLPEVELEPDVAISVVRE